MADQGHDGELQALYGEWDRLSAAERDELYRAIDVNDAEERSITALLKKSQEASEEYFADEGLGTSGDDSGSWDWLVWVGVGAVGGAIGQAIRRRRRSQGGAELLKEGEDMS